MLKSILTLALRKSLTLNLTFTVKRALLTVLSLHSLSVWQLLSGPWSGIILVTLLTCASVAALSLRKPCGFCPLRCPNCHLSTSCFFLPTSSQADVPTSSPSSFRKANESYKYKLPLYLSRTPCWHPCFVGWTLNFQNGPTFLQHCLSQLHISS